MSACTDPQGGDHAPGERHVGRAATALRPLASHVQRAPAARGARRHPAGHALRRLGPAVPAAAPAPRVPARRGAAPRQRSGRDHLAHAPAVSVHRVSGGVRQSGRDRRRRVDDRLRAAHPGRVLRPLVGIHRSPRLEPAAAVSCACAHRDPLPRILVCAAPIIPSVPRGVPRTPYLVLYLVRRTAYCWKSVRSSAYPSCTTHQVSRPRAPAHPRIEALPFPDTTHRGSPA